MKTNSVHRKEHVSNGQKTSPHGDGRMAMSSQWPSSNRDVCEDKCMQGPLELGILGGQRGPKGRSEGLCLWCLSNVLNFYAPNHFLEFWFHVRIAIQFLGSRFSFSGDISPFYVMIYTPKTWFGFLNIGLDSKLKLELYNIIWAYRNLNHQFVSIQILVWILIFIKCLAKFYKSFILIFYCFVLSKINDFVK